MSVMVNYTAAQYQAKITELEGYYSQLENHLSTMENLKNSMFDFWNDANAQEAGQSLAAEIRQVRNAMDRTSDMLTFYKSAVEKLDGANINVTSLLQDALSLLSGLGI